MITKILKKIGLWIGVVAPEPFVKIVDPIKEEITTPVTKTNKKVRVAKTKAKTTRTNRKQS